MKVEDYKISEDYKDKDNFILKIQHSYKSTQIFRKIENLELKLKEYSDFEIVEVKHIKNDLVITIKGKLKEEQRLKTKIK